jgi:hypothetical protein
VHALGALVSNGVQRPLPTGRGSQPALSDGRVVFQTKDRTSRGKIIVATS